MIGELTFLRIYWPQVFSYLKSSSVTNFKTEAFGVLMTVDLSPSVARKIMMRLPWGAVSDYREIGELNEITKN